MSSTELPLAAPKESVFPTLSEAQIARAGAHGRRRSLAPGEVLYDQGEPAHVLAIILSGEIQAVRPTELGRSVITFAGRGQFNGEINQLSGRHSMFRILASQPTEIIELDRQQLMTLVQSDAEIGEVMMRAFIFRRVALVSSGVSDVALLGSSNSADTLRLKEFLTRNGHPFAYLDLERNPDVEELMKTFQVTPGEIPVVVRGSTVWRNPSNRAIAEVLGFNESVDRAKVRDLIVIGAGPSGLAAAVYGASEGLDVLVVESNAPGGQAGSSSRIENYLGFPMGVSGQELAARAYTQAEKFGVDLLIDRVARLHCERQPYSVTLESGGDVPGRAIVIASGAQYRRPALANLTRFEGNGVYYGATFVESQLCGAQEVIVVGGGNSAGQAAVFLSETASRVYVLVRSAGLADSMSRYLSRRIEDTKNIELLTHTEIVELNGDGKLEKVRWKNNLTGESEERAIAHVFMMMGAAPCTTWLDGCLALDDKGFVKTGFDLSTEELATMRWPLARQPYLLETTLPGVFAVGDVRGGSVKRVASAVGEGSVAISFVHRFLAQT